MVELREYNGMKHILSENEEVAFAWASYFANYSNIFINGKKYTVKMVLKADLVFSNGKQTGYGNWKIFEIGNDIIVYRKEYLEQIRKENPLTKDRLCLTDEAFFRSIQEEEMVMDIYVNILKSYKNAKQEVDRWFRTAARGQEMGTKKYDIMECICCIGKAIALSQILDQEFGDDTRREREILEKIKDYLQFDMLDGLEEIS